MQHADYVLKDEGQPSPQIMGILNVTPDSFSDGGELSTLSALIQRAESHVAAGATWLDLGAESTRPGALPISCEQELQRLLPPLKALKKANLRARISVDTRRGAVADQALALGADAINDVSAMADPDMGPVVARAQVPIVLMHWAGPAPIGGDHGMAYTDVMQEVIVGLTQARDRALAAGIAGHNIWLDPGVGFGKTTAHSLILTAQLSKIVAVGQAVVYGPSRKRFLAETVGKPAQACDAATAAACCVATVAGVHMVRVHAPEAVRDAVTVGAALRAI
jgi:dihydropteroate synthase